MECESSRGRDLAEGTFGVMMAIGFREGGGGRWREEAATFSEFSSCSCGNV